MQSWAFQHRSRCTLGEAACALCSLAYDFEGLACASPEPFPPRIMLRRTLWHPPMANDDEQCPGEAFVKLMEHLTCIDEQAFKALEVPYNRAALFTLPMWSTFGALTKRTLSCSACLRVNHKLGWESIFMINTPMGRDVSVRAALLQQFERELLDGQSARCTSCHTVRCLEQELSVVIWPATMILHVRRWKLSPHGNRWVKDARPIRSDETLEVEGNQYSLRSVVVHRGSTGDGGHYVVFSTKDGKEWFGMNDAQTPVIRPWSEVRTQIAYLLCYAR